MKCIQGSIPTSFPGREEVRERKVGGGGLSHRVFDDSSHTVIVHLPAEEYEARVRTGMGD